jgi:hypothetical protein
MDSSSQTVTVPGKVWDDYLDPMVTPIAQEIGLPDYTQRRKGRGWQVVYAEVSPETARDLAGYLEDRAESLLWGSDDEDRTTHRRALDLAATIRANTNQEV